LTWDIIEEWNMDATYSINSKVIFDDILYNNVEYKSTSSPITVGYISYPGNQAWNMDISSIFWNPIFTHRIMFIILMSFIYDSLSGGFDSGI
jgi:hypothetical protein